MPIAGGDATAGGDALGRADIEVAGLEHGGPSFELRIFLNNPAADRATEPTHDNGYAGSIHVYGYGQPSPPPSPGDDPQLAGGPRMPRTRSVIATDAVRAAAGAGSLAAVTLVPVAPGGGATAVDLEGVRVRVLVDDPPAEPG